MFLTEYHIKEYLNGYAVFKQDKRISPDKAIDSWFAAESWLTNHLNNLKSQPKPDPMWTETDLSFFNTYERVRAENPEMKSIDAIEQTLNLLDKNEGHKKDPTNPDHYRSHPSGIECIQITEHMNFNLGNAVKYIWRAGLKGDLIENLRKAVWYITREIERLEKMGAPITISKVDYPNQDIFNVERELEELDKARQIHHHSI